MNNEEKQGSFFQRFCANYYGEEGCKGDVIKSLENAINSNDKLIEKEDFLETYDGVQLALYHILKLVKKEKTPAVIYRNVDCILRIISNHNKIFVRKKDIIDLYMETPNRDQKVHEDSGKTCFKLVNYYPVIVIDDKVQIIKEITSPNALGLGTLVDIIANISAICAVFFGLVYFCGKYKLFDNEQISKIFLIMVAVCIGLACFISIWRNKYKSSIISKTVEINREFDTMIMYNETQGIDRITSPNVLGLGTSFDSIANISAVGAVSFGLVYFCGKCKLFDNEQISKIFLIMGVVCIGLACFISVFGNHYKSSIIGEIIKNNEAFGKNVRDYEEKLMKSPPSTECDLPCNIELIGNQEKNLN